MALSNYAFIWALYVWVPALDVYISGSQGAVDQRPLGNGDYYLLLPLSLLCAPGRHRDCSHLRTW